MSPLLDVGALFLPQVLGWIGFDKHTELELLAADLYLLKVLEHTGWENFR
jgi:hypothetical protein